MSGNNICTGTDFTCIDGQGHSIDKTKIGADYNSISPSGFALATTRILAGYDRAITPNIAVGTRIGFVFGGNPSVEKTATNGATSALLPVHAEVRGAYWFGGNDAFSKLGIRPFAALSGGLGEVDAKLPVKVNYDGTVFRPAAWRKSGQVFVAAGGGAMYALDPKSGITAELKLIELFPSSGTGLAVQAGYAMGF